MIEINLQKAKIIAHEKRREARDVEFAPHDEAIAKQIPSKIESAEAARQEIRDRYASIQVQMDEAQNVDELKSVLLLIS